MDKIPKWERFPPTIEDERRLGDYAKYEKLMVGEHAELFNGPGITELKDYVSVNFCGVVSKLCSDLLFGEEPVYSAKPPEGSGPEINSEAQTSIDDIVKNNGLNTLCNTMAMSSSYRGDCVFKVRWGELPEGSGNFQAIVESVPSSYFFMAPHSNNVLSSKANILAWRVKKRENSKDIWFLRREVHVPGRVYQELFQMKTETEIGKKISLNALDESMGLEEVEDTGYPNFLVEYVPNWRLDNKFWGISDYKDILGLQYEINNRMTKVHTILDKHSSPKIVLPSGLLRQDDTDPEKLWLYRAELLDAIEVSDPSIVGDLPKYLVWDAKLEAAFSQIDKIIEYLMMVTETVPSAVGISTDSSGGQSESGRALRFRLMRTLGKINRKKRFFVESLSKMLYAAQFLKNKHGGGPLPVEVVVNLKDGLPDDESERADIANSRVTARTMSLRRVLSTLDSLRGNELENELAEIKKDKEIDASMDVVTNPEVDGGGTPELTNEQR